MLQGEWWVPNAEETKFSGVLSFADNKIHLELTGQATDDGLRYGVSHLEEIHGIIFGGKKITHFEQKIVGKYVILQDCLEIGHSLTMANMGLYDTVPVSTFSVSKVYLVQNSQNVKDVSLKFHEIRVGFSHLPDFAITSGRPIQQDRHFENLNLKRLEASFEFQTFPRAKIKGKTVEFDQRVSTRGDQIRQHVIEYQVYFKICSEEALSLKEWEAEYVTPLRHFLTLATTQANRVTSVRAFHNDNFEVIELNEQDNLTQVVPFEVITEEILESDSMEFRESLFRLFDLRDIKEQFEEVLSKWFELYEKHRIVQNLLFSGLLAKEIYAENRFLDLARALEVYHRSKYPRGSNSQKVTLNERLQRLLDDLEDLKLSEALNVSEEAIGKRIKDVRNHLTHYSEKPKAFTNSEVIWLFYLIEYLLQALLLQEIGFSATKIKGERNYSFRMRQIAEGLSHLRVTET